MSTSDRNAEIKSYFQRGDIPTQEDFGELVDAATTDKIANQRLPEQIDLSVLGQSSLLKAKVLIGDGAQITNIANQHLPKQIDLTTATGDGTASLTTEQLTATTVSAAALIGDGAQVTNLANSNLPKHIDLTAATGDGSASLTTEQLSATTVSANALIGDGAQVTNLANSNLPKQIDLTTATGDGTASLIADKVYATLIGDGSQVTGLDVSNLSGGKIDNSLLNEASQSTQGIAKFATVSDLENGTIDSVVSAGDLKSALDSSKGYVDQELALLQAGIKFKREVATVFTDNYDLTLGVPTELVNGYLIQTGDRVLFSAQDALAENKVWVAQADNTWLLAEDFDNTPEQELSAGISVEVLKGSDLEYSIWTVSEVSTVDTQVLLTWRKRNDVVNYQPGDGIVFDGLTIKGDQTWVEGVVQNTTINASSLQGEIASNQIANTIENKTFTGNGAGLTDLNADNIISGSLDITRLPSQLDFTRGDTVANSSVQASRFIGDGSELSNISIGNLPVASLEEVLAGDQSKLTTAQHGAWLNQKIDVLSCLTRIPLPIACIETTQDIDIDNVPSEIDGYALKNGDLVLFNAQVNQRENHIWQVNKLTEGFSAQPTDLYLPTDMRQGDAVIISHGDRYQNQAFLLKTHHRTESGDVYKWQATETLSIAGTGLVQDNSRFSVDFASEDDVTNRALDKVVGSALLQQQLTTLTPSQLQFSGANQPSVQSIAQNLEAIGAQAEQTLPTVSAVNTLLNKIQAVDSQSHNTDFTIEHNTTCFLQLNAGQEVTITLDESVNHFRVIDFASWDNTNAIVLSQASQANTLKLQLETSLKKIDFYKVDNGWHIFDGMGNKGELQASPA
ncbi:hypothetical protein PA25_05230 [Pseudoalteromonas sp. A25]|uniref:hypothetical protein n=1 Tax=Pseudoalteromonas sp. A25 TaxID=116092 RepID=UPI0012610B1D|nr:hypothetical protein [Pseudoalteromonas sp. A25]BBN80538.1 hypothetical protein PA25_05230 [Pseudoalteromonas sp. A25]